MIEPRIITGAAPDAIAEALAPLLSGGARIIAVPGGNTPVPILAALAARADIDWSRITVWPGDDRCVPSDHPASNFGMLQRALGQTHATLVPLQEGATPPMFDLMWLGLGEDGHIASLFPNVDPRADAPLTVQRITPDPLPPEAPFDRLTLTLPALARTKQLVLVLRGARKKAVLDAALAAARQPAPALPAASDLPITRLLRLVEAPVTIFWSPS